MSGYRNEQWASCKDKALGSIEDWMGITIESRIPIGLEKQPAEREVLLQWNKSLDLPDNAASMWSEALSSKDGTVLATYQKGMHKGKASQ